MLPDGGEKSDVDITESLKGAVVFYPFFFDEGDDGDTQKEIEKLLGGVTSVELHFPRDAEPEKPARSFGDNGDAAGFDHDSDGEPRVGELHRRR